MHFLLKGTGQSYYSKSKSILKCSFLSKNQTLNKISPSLLHTEHTLEPLGCELHIKCKLFGRTGFSFPTTSLPFASSQNTALGPAAPLQHLKVGLGSKSWLKNVNEYETNLHQRSASSAGFHSVTLPACRGTEFLAAQAHPGL